MTMWRIIMYVTLSVTCACLFYLSYKVGCLLFEKKENSTKTYRFLAGALIVFSLFAVLSFTLNFMNAIVCALYFAMIWFVCDVIFFLFAKIRKKTFERKYAGLTALVAGIFSLSVGWYQAHHVWQTVYTIETDKKIKDTKIVMLADSHVGTTFDGKGFAKHLKTIQDQNPDVVIVAGDFVDDDTTRQNMVEAAQALGKMNTTYGVYYVFGNHDKGYRTYRNFSGRDLVVELENNGIKVLQDEVALLGDSVYLIGRNDASTRSERGGKRQSMAELVKDLDKNKYMIVADHQPTDYKNQTAAKVDLVLSGHTHGGQLFPFNQVGKWIGANDKIYGHEKIENTDFIVTSGISDWAIKFKTGCKSEFVTVFLKSK